MFALLPANPWNAMDGCFSELHGHHDHQSDGMCTRSDSFFFETCTGSDIQMDERICICDRRSLTVRKILVLNNIEMRGGGGAGWGIP